MAENIETHGNKTTHYSIKPGSRGKSIQKLLNS